jgi:CysZ protein
MPGDSCNAEVAVRDFATGLRLFGRAAALLARAPRLYLLGVIPALITLLLFGAGFVLLIWQLDELVSWLTPFADHWSEPARQGVRVLGGAALLVTAGMLAVVSYTALTLLLGGPFYERLSGTVDGWLDGAASTGQDSATGWSGFWYGLRDSVVLVATSLACSVPLLVGGFLPLIGQTVVPVLAVAVGSWLLALELVGAPFQRRGMGLAERRRVLRERRLLTFGTAVPAYLLCAIPFTAAFVMPVAVVSGTLLTREVLADRAATGPR